ncbi:LTA synthase family protein [Alkalibacterium subtropicum]|nr:LTA synthase family protein [Alkalibacterium subtropicum]
MNSAYDLYFQTRDPILSVDRLGMITTMRLDFQRLTTGWSPTQRAPEMPDSDPEPLKEPEIKKNVLQVSNNEPGKTDRKEESVEKQPEKEIEYNTLDIDFEKLMSSETNETIRQMHQYFSRVEPTAKNDYTGKFEGYNLIFITAESFAPYTVDEELTPTLYKMMHEGYNFTDFYVPLWDVSSSDGEYVSMTSLVPKSGIWSFSASADIKLPFVMGNKLKENGYHTAAFHNHSYTYYNRDASHPNMGYKYTGIGNGLDIQGGWPRSDLEMMEASVPEYIDDEPFHVYYITVSGHMQYSFAGNNIAYKNKEYVKDLPYSDQAQAYLATQIELDKALENLLSQLDEKGIADKTLIALTTDHYPYGLDNSTIDELAGHEVEKDFERHKSSLLLYTKGMDPVTIDKPSSNLDIVPTLYNLLGIDYDSRLFMGSDIFSDARPLVMFRNKSFITDKVKYNAATKEFVPRETDSKENYDEYIDAISLLIENKFYYSVKILETDYYKTLPY